jgi:hypothetical protein
MGEDQGQMLNARRREPFWPPPFWMLRGWIGMLSRMANHVSHLSIRAGYRNLQGESIMTVERPERVGLPSLPPRP